MIYNETTRPNFISFIFPFWFLAFNPTESDVTPRKKPNELTNGNADEEQQAIGEY